MPNGTLGFHIWQLAKLTRQMKYFKKIASNPDHYYSKDAKSILEKIRKSEKNKKFLNNLFFLILPF